MRSLFAPALAALAVVALGLGVVACGGGGGDSAANAGFDADDDPVRYFGHPAGSADSRAIVAVIEHYYKAAVARDGVRGCALLYSLIAETLVDEYGQVPSLRGSTCAEVLSKLFWQHHGEVVTDLARFKPFSIRVGGDRALALYRLAPAVVHRMEVRRERGAWTVDLLLDMGLP